jgi:hypothetical protein
MRLISSSMVVHVLALCGCGFTSVLLVIRPFWRTLFIRYCAYRALSVTVFCCLGLHPVCQGWFFGKFYEGVGVGIV